jgi:hypothetical protein
MRTSGAALLIAGFVAAMASPAAAGEEPFVLNVRVAFEGAAPADETYTVEVRCSPRGGASYTFEGAGERTLETNADECSVDAAFPQGSTGLSYRCRAFDPARCTDEVNIVRRPSGASGGEATVTVTYQYPATPQTTSTSSASTTTTSASTTSSSSTSAPSTTTSTTGTSTTTATTLVVAGDVDDDDDASDVARAIAALLACGVLVGAGIALARELRRSTS